MFMNEGYDIKVIDIINGKELEIINIVPTFKQREYEIKSKPCKSNDTKETIEDIANDIIEHCKASTFAGKTLNYLTTLSKITGKDKIEDKSLRGAYFEYYVFKMLSLLKDEGVIDEVIWNGKIGKYGLPTQAPGGKTGIPDLIFKIDDVDIVIELTTIKSKSSQFKSEASSVPDHIKLYKQETENNVVGILCAPIIHERNTAAMKSTIAPFGIDLHCITDKELVKLFLSRDRNNIKKFMMSIIN